MGCAGAFQARQLRSLAGDGDRHSVMLIGLPRSGTTWLSYAPASVSAHVFAHLSRARGFSFAPMRALKATWFEAFGKGSAHAAPGHVHHRMVDVRAAAPSGPLKPRTHP